MAFQWRATRISYADELGKPITPTNWIESQQLRCTSLVTGLCPTIDQATLIYPFGTITGEGDRYPTYLPKPNLRGAYVKVEMEGVAQPWFGYIVREQFERWPEQAGRLAGGTMQYTAVGLEWFLTRAIVRSSFIDDTPIREVQRAIGFNTGWGDGRDVVYADRGNASLQTFLFASGTERTLWSAWGICLYLLTHHTPRRDRGNFPGPGIWNLDAKPGSLDWFHPTVPSEGHSVYQLLNRIVSPRRGLVWWVEWDDTRRQAYVMVDTMATSAISLPGNVTLPAASTQKSLQTLDDDYQVRRVDIAVDDSRRADQVLVRGALRRAVFTASIAAGNLEKGWRDEDEQSYKQGASQAADYPQGADERKRRNDVARESQTLERVYQVFQIPSSWTGEVAPNVFACPQFQQGTNSILGGAPIVMPGMRLLRSMPIKCGWIYSAANNPISNDPANTEAEWQRPFCVVDSGDDNHRYRFAHAVNTGPDTNDDKLASYHMHILSGAPAFQLQPSGGMPHCLAKDHFDPDADAPSNFAPEVNWQTIQATVCAEWDEYCEAYWPTNAGAFPMSKTIDLVVIDIGERARFDWVAQGTIYDVVDGELRTGQQPGSPRDDRTLCEQVAKIAHAWYGEDRGEFTITADVLSDNLKLGELITTIGADAPQTVNATVSRIEYRPEDGQTIYSGGFAELDFASLL